MSRPLPKPFSQPEKSITGLDVVGNTQSPRIRIETESIGPEAIMYSVTGPIPLGRLAISQLLSAPLGEMTDDWRSVEKGLRNISYPSNTINKLSRLPADRKRLKSLRPAAKELADILRGNQRYATTTVNLPVFTDAQAAEYTQQALVHRQPSDVKALLERYEDDSVTRLHLDLLANTSERDNWLPELSEVDQIEIRNRAMLGTVAGLAYVEAMHGVFDSTFWALREEPVLQNGQLAGGGADATVLVRKQDIPQHLQNRLSEVRVALGPVLRDPDRTIEKIADVARRKVTFFSRKHGIVAQPRISWINDGAMRRFAFPLSQNERLVLHDTIARSSSLVGAALAASRFGSAYGIDYERELRRMVGKRTKYDAPLAKAGLLALVLHTSENDLLSDPYFAAIEQRAVQ